MDITDTSEAAVIGGLYWLWATADEHTTDGVMVGLSLHQIDRKTGIQGFGQGLVDIGWIADHPEGVRIINFAEHNGASAKKRAQTAKRVAKYASTNAQITHEEDKTNAQSVSNSLGERYLEVEREEEVKNPPTPRTGGSVWKKPDWVPADLWTEFETVRKKRKKPMTDRSRALAVSKLEALQAGGNDIKAVMEQSILHAWDTFYPLKTDAVHTIAATDQYGVPL